jgi:ParB family chromosome partitioning protein
MTERQEIEAAIEQAEDSEDEETTEAHYQRLDALEEKEEKLKERLQVPDPAQVALAGALVTIDRNGKLRIERGVLKPGDAKKAASTPRSKAKAARAASGHSAPLLRRLSAHRTLALRATLAQPADIALVAITHRLVLQTFYPFGASAGNPLKVNRDVADLKSHAEDLRSQSRA